MWMRINRFVQSHTILSACVFGIIFSPALGVIGVLTDNMDPAGRLTVFTIAKLMISAIIIWLMQKMEVFDIRDFNFHRIKKVILIICAGSVIAVIGLLFALVHLPKYRFIAPNPSDFLLVAMSQVVGIGIFEEILYRGLIFKILLKNMGDSRRGTIMACIVSSVIFGLVHITNLIDIYKYAGHLSIAVVLPVLSQVVFTTAFGLLNAALFLRLGTLWIPILIHGTGNLATQTFASLLSHDRILQFLQSPASMNIPEFIMSTSVSTVPLLLAGLFLLRDIKEINCVKTKVIQQPKERKHKQ